MFRVRLASGEEAVYRSVEELALGISSGVVTDKAEIFHGTKQEWLPITGHPEFGAARARASALVLIPEPAAGPPTVLGPEEGGPQVYQMFSHSARELAERRRHRWRHHTVTITAAVLFLVSVVLVRRPERGLAENASWPSRQRAPDPGAPAQPSARPDPHLRAPYNLANRLARAQVEAGLALGDTAEKLGLTGLLTTGRLLAQDSLQGNLAALARFRPAVLAYRARLRDLRTAYRDTAETLTQSGAWDRLEAQEWRVRVTTPELRSDALQADSLALTLDAIFTLLAAEPVRPTLTNGALRLSSDSAGRAYDQLRIDLRRFRALDSGRPRRPGPPLQALIDAIGRDSLPPRRPS